MRELFKLRGAMDWTNMAEREGERAVGWWNGSVDRTIDSGRYKAYDLSSASLSSFLLINFIYLFSISIQKSV